MPKSALYLAAARGRLAEVKQLLAAGADPNQRVDGETPLHVAAGAGHVALLRPLVDAGADIDARDDDQLTPLMHAANRGNARGSQAALTLLSLGADATLIRRSDHATALTLALSRGTPALLKALIQHGAPLDGPRTTPITPLMEAAVAGRLDVVKLLVTAGADVTRRCKLPWAKGQTAAEMAAAERKKAVAVWLERRAK